jgi:predicted Rossmann-fold nucleotide-binding protein
LVPSGLTAVVVSSGCRVNCTLEEAFDAISWTQLRLQDKPTGFLNVDEFFGPTIAQLDHMVAEGFVRQEHRDGIYFDDQPPRLLQRLAGFESPDIHKWIDRDLAPEAGS